MNIKKLAFISMTFLLSISAFANLPPCPETFENGSLRLQSFMEDWKLQADREGGEFSNYLWQMTSYGATKEKYQNDRFSAEIRVSKTAYSNIEIKFDLIKTWTGSNSRHCLYKIMQKDPSKHTRFHSYPINTIEIKSILKN